MTIARSYELRFAQGSRPEYPACIVAADDARAVLMAVRLRLASAFELWDEKRFVKLVAATRFSD